METISKWKINKISMILDYVGAVIYFMSIALLFGAAINDFAEGGSSTLDGTTVLIYGYAIVALAFHIIGFRNNKKMGLKVEPYVFGMCGHGLFFLGAFFSIPATVLVVIAGYQISKARKVEDPLYVNGFDYSNGKTCKKEETVKCSNCGQEVLKGNKYCPKCGQEIKEVVPENKKVCPECGNLVSKDNKFCGECGHEFPERICKNCGKKLEDDQIFCVECGTRNEKE